jgi:hypothetical protein
MLDVMVEDINERGRRLLVARREGDVGYLRDALVDAEIRSSAARLLGVMGATEAIPQLMRLLRAGDPRTRSSALRALTRLEAREAVSSVKPLVLSDESATVRTHAVSAFRRLGQPAQTIPVLLKALRDPDGGVSACAAHQLGVIGDESAIEPLRVAQRSHSWVRAGAYRKAIRRIRLRARRWPISVDLDRAQSISNVVGFAALATITLFAAGYAAVGDIDGLLIRAAIVATAGPIGFGLLMLGVLSANGLREDAQARKALRTRTVHTADPPQ